MFVMRASRPSLCTRDVINRLLTMFFCGRHTRRWRYGLEGGSVWLVPSLSHHIIKVSNRLDHLKESVGERTA